MVEFNDLVRGLKKKGKHLTEDEEFAIRGLIESPVISPAFVRRLTQKYGPGSIASAYLIREPQDASYLSYLLRRYKGNFYRKRYPNLAIV